MGEFSCIVLDLEWNQPLDAGGAIREPFFFDSEIIEIGALKLNAQLQVVDEFKTFIRPVFYPVMNGDVVRLTKIRPQELEGAPDFPAAYRAFRDWCGEECCLCAWGTDDIPVLLDNLIMHGLETEDFPCYDLQRIFLQAYPRREGEGLTLESVVDRLGIPKEEPFHNALDDALYTAKICRKLPLAEGLATYPTEEELLTEALLGAEKTGRDVKLFMNRMEHDDYRNEPELNQAACPECGAPLQNDEVWLKRGNTGYFTRATCPCCGHYYLRFKLSRRDGLHWSFARCIDPATPESDARWDKQKAALLERMKKKAER